MARSKTIKDFDRRTRIMNKHNPKRRKARGRKARGRGPGKSGNPKRQADHYRSLAQEAMSGGDRVMAEHYYQHMDHYMRLLNGNGDGPSPNGHDAPKQKPRPGKTGGEPKPAQGGSQPQTGAQA